MYCSLDDLKKYKDPIIFAQITNDENGQAIDEVIIDETIDKSVNIINGFIGCRYDLPLSIVPKIIRNISIDLTVKFLYERRFSGDISEDNTVEKSYREAMKLLEKIREGKIFIQELDVKEQLGDGYFKVNKSKEDRIFNSDLLNQF